LKVTTAQNRYVLSIIDRATGWPEMLPTVDCTATTAVRVLIKTWICRYGVPKIVVSDNGRHFTAKQFKEATEVMGIRVKHPTTYHPQSNGVAER
jgi:transposase InsO family protein